MAVAFLASIYGVNFNSVQGTQGSLISFPAASVLVRPVILDSTQTGVYNTVTVRSIIQLLPSGTVVNQPQYYTDLTVTQVNTLRNS